MNLKIEPSAILNPRFAFFVFLSVFFLPLLGFMDVEHAFVILIGSISFCVGSLFVVKHTPVAWPKLKYSFGLMIFIIGVKLIVLVHGLNYDLSIDNIIINLANESVLQKQNVAFGVVLNSVVTLIFWVNLIGLSQKGSLSKSLFWLFVFQIASQQTGRFLIISQMLLLIIIHYDINSKRFNAIALTSAFFAMLVIFPLLHSVRSGDIKKTDVNVYGLDYLAEIVNADAAPGKYFLNLIDYVDDNGYNFGYFVSIIPAQLIPRYIWSDKPITSLQAVYTDKIYDMDHLDGVTFTFTIFDSYSYFGIYSVVLVSVFWGVIFMNLFNLYPSINRPFLKIQTGFILINSFNFYRGNVSDFIAPILIGFLISFLLDFFVSKFFIQKN